MEPLRPSLAEAKDPSSSMGVQTYRGRGEERVNSSSVGIRVLARRKSPIEGVQGRRDKVGEYTNGSPPDVLLVLSSNSLCSELEAVLDPVILFVQSLRLYWTLQLSKLTFLVRIQVNLKCLVIAWERRGMIPSPTFVLSEGNKSPILFYNQEWDKELEASSKEWPLTMIENTSKGKESIEPLAVDFSFFRRPCTDYSVEEVWDGENLNTEIVSKWVSSKLKVIAGCIGVAFSGHEMETIHLLSRIERTLALAKTSAQRSPSSSIRSRELRRLEFGVNYDRSSTSGGWKVSNG